MTIPNSLDQKMMQSYVESTDVENKPCVAVVNPDGTSIMDGVSVTISPGDVEIGAVEIKNSTDDTRATVGANGLYTEVRASALPTGAATETSAAAAATSLAVMDDWDESDRAKVNIIVGQAGIAAGTGVDGATVPRVTLATNVGLPAGSSLIGQVNAIGDVAHDAVDSGNPIKIGGYASATPPAGVSSGDRVNAYFDLNGRLVVYDDSTDGNLQEIINTTSETAANVTNVNDSLLFINENIFNNWVDQGTAISGIKNILEAGSVTTAAPSYTNGQVSPLSLTTAGALRVDNSAVTQPIIPLPIVGNTYTASVAQNNSFTTLNLKASAGNLLRVSCINTTGSTRYLQFHNTATTPGGGATALIKFLIPANSQIIIGPGDIGIAGIYFSTGIAYANSTVASTYTAGSAGDLLLEVNYI